MQRGLFEECPVSARGRIRSCLRAFEGPDLPSLTVDALSANSIKDYERSNMLTYGLVLLRGSISLASPLVTRRNFAVVARADLNVINANYPEAVWLSRIT